MVSTKSYQKEQLSELDTCNKVIKSFNETNKLEGVLEYVLETCYNSLLRNYNLGLKATMRLIQTTFPHQKRHKVTQKQTCVTLQIERRICGIGWTLTKASRNDKANVQMIHCMYKVLPGGCHLYSRPWKLSTLQTSHQFTPHYRSMRQAVILPILYSQGNKAQKEICPQSLKIIQSSDLRITFKTTFLLTYLLLIRELNKLEKERGWSVLLENVNICALICQNY